MTGAPAYVVAEPAGLRECSSCPWRGVPTLVGGRYKVSRSRVLARRWWPWSSRPEVMRVQDVETVEQCPACRAALRVRCSGCGADLTGAGRGRDGVGRCDPCVAREASELAARAGGGLVGELMEKVAESAIRGDG